jgi:hypothetical protein
MSSPSPSFLKSTAPRANRLVIFDNDLDLPTEDAALVVSFFDRKFDALDLVTPRLVDKAAVWGNQTKS